MKSMMKEWMARSAFVALVATGMLLAGPRYALANHCTGPERPGECPPLTTPQCSSLCMSLGYSGGGACVGHCCTCFV